MLMDTEAHQKVRTEHQSRLAYLYVRQSTLRQVFENTESTLRQYALRERAVALGWPLDRIIVIDSDLGQSGASAADREGFQRLVTEVSLGRVGIVLGLEVSRLARNSTSGLLLNGEFAEAPARQLAKQCFYRRCRWIGRSSISARHTLCGSERDWRSDDRNRKGGDVRILIMRGLIL